MTDAEHRALDERLDILGWAIALLVLAVMLYLPGVRALWQFLVPFGLVFIGMSVARRLIRTRRDPEGLILGIAALVIGLLDVVGIDLRFFPLVPTFLALVGVLLLANALLVKRLRKDPVRPSE
jgi:CHASE2 domain-containing sensor protein